MDTTQGLLPPPPPPPDTIRIKRVPFFPRIGNDLPAQSVHPAGLRGHGLGDVIRIRGVLFGGRRADKPLKGPASPSSKVY